MNGQGSRRRLTAGRPHWERELCRGTSLDTNSWPAFATFFANTPPLSNVYEQVFRNEVSKKVPAAKQFWTWNGCLPAPWSKDAAECFRKHKLKFNSQDKIYAKRFPAKKWKLLIPSKNGSVGKNMKYSVARHPTRRCPDLARRLFKNWLCFFSASVALHFDLYNFLTRAAFHFCLLCTDIHYLPKIYLPEKSSSFHIA